MSRIPHYPKIWNLGNDAIEQLFTGEVEITEKVDGSQFGFGVSESGELLIRSKGKEMYLESPEKMFQKAVDQVLARRDLLLNYANVHGPFYVYGEYLSKPKHNVLKYDRIPKDNIIIFGAKIREKFIKVHAGLKGLGDYLGFETVPLIYQGAFSNDRVAKSEFGNPEQVKRFGYTAYEKLKAIIYSTQSVLGGTLIEGVVVKNYNQICAIGAGTDPQFGKYVREDFKEALHKEWGDISGKNALQEFIDGFKSEARWLKAVQHLRERGELENSPRDIGKLIVEIKKDVTEEEKTNIEHFLYRYFIPDILRRSSAGMPEWYKDKLLQKQFEDKNES